MFCPKCKAEYRAGFYTCSDCALPLVDELPPEQPHDPVAPDTEYVELTSTFDPMAVPLIKSVLEAEGIEYHLIGEHTSGLGLHFTPVRVMVGAGQAEQAVEVLGEFGLGPGAESAK